MKPNNSSAFIRWLFNDRCIGIDGACYEKATEVHEIVPRSYGKESMHWKNRVTLCKNHHDSCHHQGISDELILILQKRRRIVLEFFCNYEYI